eukprot:COSAG01_NODE_5233_length_4395_cov_932.807728_7_plen_102_part_00
MVAPVASGATTTTTSEPQEATQAQATSPSVGPGAEAAPRLYTAVVKVSAIQKLFADSTNTRFDVCPDEPHNGIEQAAGFASPAISVCLFVACLQNSQIRRA